MKDHKRAHGHQHHAAEQLSVAVIENDHDHAEAKETDAGSTLQPRGIWNKWRSLSFDRQVELFVTIAIGIATVVYAGFSIGLWSETGELATEAAAQSAASTRAAKAAEDAATEAKRASRLAEDQANFALIQADAATRGVDLAGESNRISAGSAIQSLQSARLDQRAWMIVSGFSLDHEIESGSIVKVKVSIGNTGHTAALDAINRTQAAFAPASLTPLFDLERSREQNPSIIFPGAAGLSFDSPEIQVGPDEAANFKTRKTRLYIETLISYSDVFGTKHWTRVCAYHQFGQVLTEFTFCPTGNGIDR